MAQQFTAEQKLAFMVIGGGKAFQSDENCIDYKNTFRYEIVFRCACRFRERSNVPYSALCIYAVKPEASLLKYNWL